MKGEIKMVELNGVKMNDINEGLLVKKELIERYSDYVWKLAHQIDCSNAMSVEDLYQEGIIELLTLHDENPGMYENNDSDFFGILGTRLRQGYIDIARKENNRKHESYEVLFEESASNYIPLMVLGGLHWAKFEKAIDLRHMVSLVESKLPEKMKAMFELIYKPSDTDMSAWDAFCSLYIRKPKAFNHSFIAYRLNLTIEEVRNHIEQLTSVLRFELA